MTPLSSPLRSPSAEAQPCRVGVAENVLAPAYQMRQAGGWQWTTFQPVIADCFDNLVFFAALFQRWLCLGCEDRAPLCCMICCGWPLMPTAPWLAVIPNGVCFGSPDQTIEPRQHSNKLRYAETTMRTACDHRVLRFSSISLVSVGVQDPAGTPS